MANGTEIIKNLAVLDIYYMFGDILFFYRLGFLCAFVFLSFEGCSTNALVPNATQTVQQKSNALESTHRNLTDANATSTPYPIPTASVIALPTYPMHNHQLSAAEVGNLIDQGMPSTTVAKLKSLLTGFMLQDFDPNATASQYDIAVIDGSTNTILYNRAALLGSLQIACPPDEVCGNPPVQLRLPNSDFGYSRYVPSASPGSGPYRRMVTSYNMPEYASNGDNIDPFVTGILSAFCGNGGMKTSGFAGAAYMGGWSADAEPADSDFEPLEATAVDSGLQYNRKLGNSDDTYTPFISLSGIGFTGTTYADSGNGAPPLQPQGNQFRFGCGTQIRNTFSVTNNVAGTDTSDVALVESANGFDPNTNETREILVIYDATNSNGDFNGWSSSCNQCVMKYMVSIAQTSNGTKENLHDGSLFEGRWSDISVSCGFTTFGMCDSGENSYTWDESTTLNCTEYANYYSTFNGGLRDCTQQPSNSQANVYYETPFSYSGGDILIDDPLPAATPAPTPGPSPQPTPSPTASPFILKRPNPLPSCGTPKRHCGDPDPLATAVSEPASPGQ